jgi:hypothetical protein
MVGPTVVRATVVRPTVVGATVVGATVVGATVVGPTVAITGRIGSIGGCGRIGIGRTFGRFSSRCCGSIGRAAISGRGNRLISSRRRRRAVGARAVRGDDGSRSVLTGWRPAVAEVRGAADYDDQGPSDNPYCLASHKKLPGFVKRIANVTYLVITEHIAKSWVPIQKKLKKLKRLNSPLEC